MRDAPVVFKQRAQTDENKAKSRSDEEKGSKRRIERKDTKGDDAPRKGGKSDNPLIRYFQETAVELRKVAWPTRETITRLTLIVLGALVVFSIFFGTLDLAFQQLIALFV
jgi:preprotein translocase SecE subunit